MPQKTQNTFSKFVQFTKVEETGDGKAVVFGIATRQKADLDNETCRYQTAKGVYMTWSKASAKRTKGAGQAVSLGNVRLQHGLEIGGKVTVIEYDDEGKIINVGSVPINDDVLGNLREGYYTGYSQGGSYASRECAVCETALPLVQGCNYCPQCDKNVEVVYDLRSLSEISYVDSPCSGEGFEYVKANGSTSLVKFKKKEPDMAKEKKTKRVAGVDLTPDCFAYVGDPEKTATWKLPIKFPGDEEKTKSHIRNALARFEQTKGIPADKKDEVKQKIHAAAKQHDIDVEEENTKTTTQMDSIKAKLMEMVNEKLAARGIKIRKGMWDVSRMAELLAVLASLWQQAVWERDCEGDDSEVPEELKDSLDTLIETFVAMAEEEAKELASKAAKTKTGDTNMETPEQKAEREQRETLEKAAKKTLATHFAKKSVHHERMEDHHEKMADNHMEMADHHEKMHKLDVGTGAEGTAGESIGPAVVSFHKAACATCKAMHKVEMGKAKDHGKMATHYKAMADSQDSEEAGKAVAAEGFTKTKRDAKQPDPEKKDDGLSETMAKAIKTADEALLKDPEFQKALLEKRKAALLAGAEGALVELDPNTLRPTSVKGAGPTLIHRDPPSGDALKATGTDDVGF